MAYGMACHMPYIFHTIYALRRVHATNYMGKDLLDITLRKYCMRVMLRNEKIISQTKNVDDNGGERQ